jgi:gliding motility-associated-like protein
VNGAVQVISDADCNHTFFIPNVFSPNGDNINDDWIVVPSDPDIIEMQCRIFDRWGDLVFETNENPVLWNGMFRAEEMSPGVYVYLMELHYRNGQMQVITGDVTLVK